MTLYVLFENENTFLFLYFIWILLNQQMCQIILPDPVFFLCYNFILSSGENHCVYTKKKAVNYCSMT